MQFLELPRELRNLIYTFTLCASGSGGKVRIKRPTHDRGTREKYQKLALFVVCRQIHAETLPIFYGKNVFYVDSSDHLRFLVREHNAQYIRAISLAPTPETAFHRAHFMSALGRLS